MSFDESRERDRALRVATAANRYTPEDATRALILLLSHVIPVMVEEGAYERHREEGCDPCHRAVVWLPILNGTRLGRDT